MKKDTYPFLLLVIQSPLAHISTSGTLALNYQNIMSSNSEGLVTTDAIRVRWAEIVYCYH